MPTIRLLFFIRLLLHTLPSNANCPPLLSTTTRLVGGTRATPASQSYTASIVNPFYSSCTASLLSPLWVLTARHCDPTNATFVFVSSERRASGILLPVKATFHHYGPGQSNDISLIQLAEPAPSDLTFVKINTNASHPRPNAAVRSVGFGNTMYAGPGNDQLRQVDTPTVDLKECISLLSDKSDYLEVDERSICSGYRRGRCGVCHGDSGGPLVQFDAEGRVVQVGVTSRGLGCAWRSSPGVFVRVSHFVDWMTRVGAEFETSDQAVQVDAGVENTDF